MGALDHVRQVTTDYRQRLYERYASEQMGVSAQHLEVALANGMPYYQRLVARHIPKNRNSKILDIGCGYGPLLYELKRAGYVNIAGVDTSPEQVKVGREIGLDCVTQGSLMDSLAANPECSVDVITAIDVLEHFGKEEAMALMDASYRALKAGGRLILHVPNGEAIFSGKIFFGDFTHQVAFTHKSARQLALACGFSRVECYEDKPIPHGFVSTIRAALWWMVRTKYRIENAIETGDPGYDLILSQNLLAVCLKEDIAAKVR